MQVTESMFFTARPDGIGTQGAKIAEKKYIFFSADPGGIGSAFHRAEEGRKENDLLLGDTQKP